MKMKKIVLPTCKTWLNTSKYAPISMMLMSGFHKVIN